LKKVYKHQSQKSSSFRLGFWPALAWPPNGIQATNRPIGFYLRYLAHITSPLDRPSANHTSPMENTLANSANRCPPKSTRTAGFDCSKTGTDLFPAPDPGPQCLWPQNCRTQHQNKRGQHKHLIHEPVRTPDRPLRLRQEPDEQSGDDQDFSHRHANGQQARVPGPCQQRPGQPEVCNRPQIPVDIGCLCLIVGHRKADREKVFNKDGPGHKDHEQMCEKPDPRALDTFNGRCHCGTPSGEFRLKLTSDDR